MSYEPPFTCSLGFFSFPKIKERTEITPAPLPKTIFFHDNKLYLLNYTTPVDHVNPIYINRKCYKELLLQIGQATATLAII
jgi:hypothetical protein